MDSEEKLREIFPLLLKQQQELVYFDSSEDALRFCSDMIDIFVQVNFVGPPPVEEGPLWTAEQKSLLAQRLVCDGERAFGMASRHDCLLAARTAAAALVQQRHALGPLMSLRCIWLHQKLLSECSPSLLAETDALMAHVGSQPQPLQLEHTVEWHLLAMRLYLFWYSYERAETHLKAAEAALGLSCYMDGAAARGTRFQKDCITHLVLRVTKEAAAPSEEEAAPAEDMPVDVALQDDTLLPDTQFEEAALQLPLAGLSQLDQAALLARAELCRASHAIDETQRSQLAAYVRAALRCAHGSWAARTTALATRCTLEQGKSRRMERYLGQIEALAAQWARTEPAFAPTRRHGFFAATAPSRWQLHLNMAQVELSFGNHKTAAEVFMLWEQWHDVIRCYQHLGRSGAAEQLIRRRLEVDGDSTELLCALGDATSAPEHYEKAWLLSGQRSARAMRSLAYHCLREKDFVGAVERFERSLSVNPLQAGLWFTYGCCCLQAKLLVKGETAFRRCVQLNPGNFEAWTNLSAVVVKQIYQQHDGDGDDAASAAPGFSAEERLTRKKKAFRLIKEALKLSFDNPIIWENYIVIAVDVGEMEEAARAYHRLLDLKATFSDPEILEILVRAVCSGDKVTHADRLRVKIAELCGRQTAQVTNDARLWAAYAELLLCPPAPTEQPQIQQRQRGLQYLLKAHRCRVQPAGSARWELDVTRRLDVVTKALAIAQHFMSAAEAGAADASLLTSCRLMLRGVLSTVQRQLDNEVLAVAAAPDSETAVALPLEEALSKMQLALDAVEEKFKAL